MTLHKVGQMKSAVLADDVKAVTINLPSSLEESSTLKDPRDNHFFIRWL